MSAGYPLCEALVVREEDGLKLCSPLVGLWRNRPAAGALIRPGVSLGQIEVLGRLHTVVAPAGAMGVVVLEEHGSLARQPVDYGAGLVKLTAVDALEQGGASADDETAAASGANVFAAPMSGRFYSRPTPDDDPFVAAGIRVGAGQTLCLLEVMKTFNRVTYSGSEPTTIVQVLCADGDDVEEGQPLFELES